MQDEHRERGRSAEGPTEIPSRGWIDILWRTFKEVSDDRVLLVAAGVTFYLLLALAPTIAAFVSVYGLFLDPASIQDQMQALRGILPGGGMEILESQVSRMAEAGQGALGFAFALSLGLALWSANAGTKAMFEAMNVAYDETEDRGFVMLTAVTMTITVLTLTSIIALIGANLAFGSLASITGLDRLPGWVVDAVTAGVALLALILFMAILYRFGPSRESPRMSWITPGAVFAGLGAVAVSVAFSFYVSNFGSYNETYGSPGAIIGFLTWLWLTIVVLILGAEINSEMEHQTGRDTTTGASRPMGSRGAVMADRIGESYGADESPAAGGEDERTGRHDGDAAERTETASPAPTLAGLAILLGVAALRAAFRNDGRRR